MVDFLDLATSSRWLIERALSQQDDDFAQLDVSSSSAASPTLPDDGYSYGATETRPVLSKSAEAELYLLATNFLLYVAMVIITTMVAKIYFPESLERGQEPATLKRNYDYRRKRKDSASDFGSISEEEARFLNSNSDDEELYSDEDDDYDEEEGDEDNSEGEEAYLDDSPKVLEFDQVHTSRTQVIQRLLFCSLMLNITFVSWGALQERMLTRRYPRHTGDYFTYSYALVFTNRFWTLVMSGMLLLYLKPRMSRSTVLYEYSFPSISNMLSSWCQYEALRYVSFPATTIFKSFKLAPVMLMGKILGNKSCKCEL